MKPHVVVLAATLLLAASSAGAAEAPRQAGLPNPITDRTFVAAMVGQPNKPPLAGQPLEDETVRIAKLLRCPVCQGSTVADSPSETAVNMKNEVRDLVKQGFDEEQVLQYFELSYGEFVRLEPRSHGIGWMVWGLPAIGLLGGAIAIGWSLKRMQRAPVAGEPAATPNDVTSEEIPLPDDAELASYVKQVRRTVGLPEDGRG